MNKRNPRGDYWKKRYAAIKAGTFELQRRKNKPRPVESRAGCRPYQSFDFQAQMAKAVDAFLKFPPRHSSITRGDALRSKRSGICNFPDPFKEEA